MNWLSPDFDCECRICGTVPTVVVMGHQQPKTELCGSCFFKNRRMTDWQLWNDNDQQTEE